MPDIFAILRIASTAFSTVFGSVGVFFAYFSFQLPVLGGQAALFLAIATAIVWATGERKRR